MGIWYCTNFFSFLRFKQASIWQTKGVVKSIYFLNISVQFRRQQHVGVHPEKVLQVKKWLCRSGKWFGDLQLGIITKGKAITYL